jgi:putative tricarboxylic transport membrane protein
MPMAAAVRRGRSRLAPSTSMQRISGTSLIGIVMALMAAWLIFHTFSDVYRLPYQASGRGPVFYPRIVLVCLLVFALAVIWEGRNEPGITLNWPVLIPVISVLAATGLYVVAIGSLGFLIATIGYTLALPVLLGYRKLPIVIAIAAIYPVAVWYLFDRIVQILLPASPWFEIF